MKFLIRLIMLSFERAKLSHLVKTHSSVLYQIALSILEDELLAEQAVLQTFSKIIPYLKKISVKNFDKTKGFLFVVIKYITLPESPYSEEEYAALFSGIQPDIVTSNSFTNNPHSRQLFSLLISLDPVKQDLLLLLYLYRINLEIAANLLNLPLVTAKEYLQEAEEYLKKEFTAIQAPPETHKQSDQS